MSNQRGRTSAAERALGQAPASIERPEPPEDLTDEQKEEWRAVVARLKPDWFGRETHTLLSHYCRHAEAARAVARLIAETGYRQDVDDLDKLLKMQEREGRAMTSLATKLRITPQSTRTPDQKKLDSAPGRKPWQTA